MQLVHKTVTHKSRLKRRFGVIDDPALLSLMEAVGRKFAAEPKMQGEHPSELLGIFLLPNNNVVEIYLGTSGRVVGYLFVNLDVWMSFL